MSLLTPLFLVALAGLAIPVLLHLIQKERKNVVQFPSLMFLRRIPYQSVQRRRIRHWLLLAMRLAALALIVLAFARPFFRRQDVGAAAASGAREVVVLVDRSYSMEYGDHWQRALSAARDAINGLNPSDRGSIVLFASGAGKGLFDGCIYAAMHDVVPPAARATAVGLMTLVGFCGAGLAPIGVAQASGLIGMAPAMTSLAFLYLAAAILLVATRSSTLRTILETPAVEDRR